MADVTDVEPLIESFDVAAGYLDWARFGPLSPSVRAEMHADAELLGSGRSSGVDLVGARIGEARDLIGTILGAPADEIVLQPSTTHGLAHALFGLDGTVIVPSEDFPSVRLMAHRAAVTRGMLDVREIDPPDGIVTVDSVVDALTDDVTAVAVSLVDFRTGALLDLAGLRDAVGDRLLIIDAVQAFGVVDVDWSAADVVVGNGYKWLRAGRGTGFARFSPRARERIEPVLSGISGMQGDATTLGVPVPRAGAAAYSIAPSDPLAASRLAASLREILAVGTADIAAEVRRRAADVMSLADRYEVPVLTPRDAHAGIVALVPSDPPVLAAALANHGVTVTARGTSIRVSAHVGTGADSMMLLGDALADAATAGRIVAVEYAREELGGEPDAPDVITIDLPEPAPADEPESVLEAVEATENATGGGDGTEPEALTADVVIAVVDDESIEN